VLYETLTGRRAFEGKSQLSALTAILEKDPEPVSAVQPATPPALDYAVQTCLEKNPEERFQSAHDVKLQLAWVLNVGSQPGMTAVGVSKRRTSRLLVAAVTAVLAIVIIAYSRGRSRAHSVRQVMRATLLPPEGARFAPLYRNGPPAISPDGTRIAFVANRDGRRSIWIPGLDKLEATELTGTQA